MLEPEYVAVKDAVSIGGPLNPLVELHYRVPSTGEYHTLEGYHVGRMVMVANATIWLDVQESASEQTKTPRKSTKARRKTSTV